MQGIRLDLIHSARHLHQIGDPGDGDAVDHDRLEELLGGRSAPNARSRKTLMPVMTPWEILRWNGSEYLAAGLPSQGGWETTGPVVVGEAMAATPWAKPGRLMARAETTDGGWLREGSVHQAGGDQARRQRRGRGVPMLQARGLRVRGSLSPSRRREGRYARPASWVTWSVSIRTSVAPDATGLNS